MAKLTQFSITKTLQDAENRVLQETGLTRTVYHKKALENYFLQENPTIHERLLIRKKSDPQYVRRRVNEAVYLSEEEREKLSEIAQKYNVSIGTVFLEALLEYTVTQIERCGLDGEYES